jgi:alpha-1,2-mannosyltransferase
MNRRLALLAGVAGIMSVIATVLLGDRDSFDFQLYAQAAATLAGGGNPYAQEYEAMLGDHIFSGYYFYPPLVAVLLSWCVSFGLPVSANCWFALNCGVIGAGAIALAEFARRYGAALRSQVLIIVAVYSWPPTLDGLEFGQINPYVFAALSLALVAMSREAWGWCGGLIGFATAVKMSPAILVFSLLFARKRSAIVSFGAVLLAFLMVGLFSPRGAQIYDDCLRGISPLVQGSRNWEIPENYSLARLVGYVIPTLSSTALMGWIVGLTILGFGVTEFSIRDRSTEQIQRHFAVAVVAMILVSPIVWFHHLIWALIPITAALLFSNCNGRAVVAMVSTVLGVSLYADVSFQLWARGGFEVDRALWVGPVVVVVPMIVIAAVLRGGKLRG